MPRFITIPALIDPHVHFRTPGGEHKEDWASGTRAALSGGVATVFDMPNTSPATTSLELVRTKKALIAETLQKSDQQIRYHVYLGATENNVGELAAAKDEIVGVKLFMGASTGNLQVENVEAQEAIFAECGRLGIPLAVHAEDETTLQKAKAEYTGKELSITDHSIIRPVEAAVIAVERACTLTAKYHTRLYILHVSTEAELEVIRAAKKRAVDVYAEVTPHHLFLTTNDYERLGTLGQMNPPLRSERDQAALWAALLDGTIDTIGTDHAPHTLEEKQQPYGKAPSGVPGIETYLALLLDAHLKGKLTLNDISRLTRTNAQKIFRLPENSDTVTVDLELTKTIKNEDLFTKCKWSPFAGQTLTGWPIKTIINN